MKDDAIPLINAYKMQYHVHISGNSKASKSDVEDLVRKCIERYTAFTSASKAQKSETKEQADAAAMESRPSDDFYIMAAMALVTYSQAGESSNKASNTSLIRAAGLLEQLLVDSPHHYTAILILIRIYVLLGAGSIALKLFGKLSVKQIQYESVAHNLYTRFATIHPYPGPAIEGAEYKDFDPQAAFVRALDFYRSANVTISHNLTRGLNDGSYVNLEDSIELGNQLRNSVCRRMWALDIRRMQRITKGEHLSFHEDVGAYISNSPPLSTL
jgi:N-terminal acetyltransferase B complex non-catalytic subunit